MRIDVQDRDPNRPMPTIVPNDAPPGQWERREEYEPSVPDDPTSDFLLVDVQWVWVADPPKSAEQLAREYAEATLAAAVESRKALDLGAVREVISKLDPSAMRQPAGGFDVLGRTVIGEAEINRTNESIANVAEALVAVMGMVEGQSQALDQVVESAAATLQAIVTPAAMLSTDSPVTA